MVTIKEKTIALWTIVYCAFGYMDAIIGTYVFDKKKNRCISCTDMFTKINFHSIFDTFKSAVELIFDSSDSIFLAFNKSLTSLAVII